MKRNPVPGSVNPNREQTSAPGVTPKPAPRHPSPHETNADNRQAQIKSLPVNARSVELHIGELVLHGFAASDRRPIADAIERELSALFAREDLPVDQSFEVAHLNGGAFRVDKNDRQESAGANVARAIYGGLRR